MRWEAIALCALAAGCLQSEVVECADGRVCPANSFCDDVHHGCAQAVQFTLCTNMPNGTTCAISTAGDGVCDSEICLPTRCGDGYLRGGEQCDGERFAGIGNCQQLGYYDDVPLRCNDDCSLDERTCTGFCGDGTIQAPLELCEGTTPPPLSCVDLGYGAGFLSCNQCGPGLTDCKLIGWQTQFLAGQLLDIDGTSDNDIWAVGLVAGASLVAHFDGLSWTYPSLAACPTPIPSQFEHVWTAGAETFISSAADVFQIDASGCTKSTVPGRVQDLWGANATNVIATTDVGTFRFDGTSWTMLDATPTGPIWGASANDFYVVTTEVGTQRLAHYTGTWSFVSAGALGFAGDVYGVWGASSTEVYVAGEGELIVQGSGTSWTSIAAGKPPIGDAGIGAVSGGTVFLRSPYNLIARIGTEWVDLQPPAFQAANNPMWASPSGNLYALDGSRINIFRGNTRSTEQVATNFAGADGIVVVGANSAFALRQGTIYVWDGLTWDQDSTLLITDIARVGTTMVATTASSVVQRSGPDNWISTGAPGGQRVWGTSLTDLWIAQVSQLVHWTGSSGTPFFNSVFILGVWVESPTSAYLAHYDASGTAAIEHWNGTDWSLAYTATTVFPDAIWGLGSHVWVVGGDRMAHFDGTNWTEEKTLDGAGTFAVWGTAPDDLFFGGNRLIHFDGLRWAPVDTGNTLQTIGIDGVAAAMFFVDAEGVHRLIRTRPW